MSIPLQFQQLVIALFSYVLIEAILDVATKSPLWLVGQVRRWWLEIVYLGKLIRYDPEGENRFAQWNPQYTRFIALKSIQAQVDNKPDDPQPILELLDQSITHGKSVIIIGLPGSGKTTSLEALTFRLARRAYFRSILFWFVWLDVTVCLEYWSHIASVVFLAGFPVLIGLIRLWQTPFFASLNTYVGPDTNTFLSRIIKDAVDTDALIKIKGRCIFLLDGINEISNPFYGPFLEDWRSQKTRFPALFTCRRGEEPWDRRNLQNQNNPFDTWLEVEELEIDGVKKFIEVYLREKQAGEKYPQISINKVWEASRNIEFKRGDIDKELEELRNNNLLERSGIGRNPYWLRMIVRSGLHTRNRARLFLGFVHELINREIDPKREGRKRRTEWKATVPLKIEMDALGKLAFSMQRRELVGYQGETGWQQGQKAIADALGGTNGYTSNDVLSEAEAATLIRWKYQEEILFTHQLIQEFFVAYASRKENDWIDVLVHAENSTWWQVLFLLGGLLSDEPDNRPAGLLEKYAHQVLGDGQDLMHIFASIGLILSVDAAGEKKFFIDVMTALEKEITIPLTMNAENGVKMLTNIIGDPLADYYSDLLKSENQDLRMKGVWLLKAINNQYSFGKLIPALLDSIPLVRETAIYALGSFGQSAVDPLLIALKNGSTTMRQSLIKVLGKIGDVRTVDPLISELKHNDSLVRQVAAEALGLIGDARALGPLTVTMIDRSTSVRLASVEAMGKIRDTQALFPLITALKDDDKLVRQAAVVALGKIGDARAVNPLITVLNDEIEAVRQAATEVLGKFGQPAVDPLTGALKSRVSYVRFAAAVALGMIGDRRTIDPLITALINGPWAVQDAAAEALVKIGQPAVNPLVAALKYGDLLSHEISIRALREIGIAHAVPALLAALLDRSNPVNLSVIEELGVIGDERAVVPLIITLKDPDYLIRKETIEALGKIGDRRAVDPLIAALNDEYEIVRKVTIEALGKIGDEWAVVPLIITLKDPSFWIRKETIVALGKIGDRRAVDPLIAALKDEHWIARKVTAEVLGKIGDERAVVPLIAALNDEHEIVRKVTAEVLGKIGDERAVVPLIAALNDEHEIVRKVTIEALGKIGDERAVVPLIAALKDPDYLIRKETIVALGKIGDRRAVDPLIAALNDENWIVREETAKALGNLGDARAIEPLKTTFKDRIEIVRQAAAGALEKLVAK